MLKLLAACAALLALSPAVLAGHTSYFSARGYAVDAGAVLAAQVDWTDVSVGDMRVVLADPLSGAAVVDVTFLARVECGIGGPGCLFVPYFAQALPIRATSLDPAVDFDLVGTRGWAGSVVLVGHFGDAQVVVANGPYGL